MMWTIALLPIVPAFAGISYTLANSVNWIGPQSSPRSIHGILAALWTLGFLLVWRSMIVWTIGRSALTCVISVVPFIQVLWAQPLWNVGCESDTLQFGQHNVCMGIYPWLAVWAWWSWERKAMKQDENTPKAGARMPATAQCIVQSIGSIPFLFGVWLIVGLALHKTMLSESWNITIALESAAIVDIVVWILIWRRVVQEWERVAFQVIFSALPMLLLPSLGPALLLPSTNSVFEAIVYAAPVMLWGIWMGGTVAFWTLRADPVRTSTTPRCPQCSYLLTGLRATRCPECGNEPTLDELWAATAGDCV
ncbi:MAG: hypothetical protein HY287_04185 [Planctomycetes bacterium]|nr:hypothetical protein [Planctomycetota bacterium]MBI3833512.1 hypothetical protein [Planctomycetota bacterium]